MELRVEEQGLNVTITAYCPDDGAGLYKVYLKGLRPFLLGTLVPENSLLKLTRTLSKNQLKEAGVYPVSQGEKVLVFPFKNDIIPEGWYKLESGMFETLKEKVKGELFYKDAGENINICWEYRCEREIHFTECFCFLSLETWGDKQFFVLSLKKNNV